MSHVFISYSKKDKKYAFALAAKLQEHNIEVWIDNKISASEDWWETIHEAIKTCAVFVVIMSSNSEVSKWVQREITLADSFEKPAFPLLLEGDADLIHSVQWSIYVRTQYVDVRDSNLPDEKFFQRLRQILKLQDVEQVNLVQSLTSAFPAVTEIETIRGIGLRDDLPDIDWVKISSGRFISGEAHNERSIHLEEFSISRYPTTYEQYSAFIRNGDYSKAKYWTSQGWEWLRSKRIASLPEWDNPDWNIPTHPVVFVSWFEATAFCNWLSSKLNLDIKLPTDNQWEKAARGTDGYIYPWGNEFKSDFANTNTKYYSGYDENPDALRLAQPVTESTHTSPYGVRDICGNVWEWCNSIESHQITLPDTEHNMRGGSWYFGSVEAKATFKLPMPASAIRYEGGFRVSMTK